MMLTANGNHYPLWMMPSFIVLFIALGLAPTRAQDTPQEKKFTHPDQRIAMPADWLQKPVKYEIDAANADLAVLLEQDVYQLMLPLIQSYAKQNNIKIAIKKGTCSLAEGALRRKAVDIGGFCCPPSRDDRLPGLLFHTLGIVAKAILVNPANPVEALTIEQARDVFRGKIAKWSALKTKNGQPAPDWPIRPVGRLHCKGKPGHWYLLLPDQNQFSPLLTEVGSIPDMIALVGADQSAIGWEVLGMAELYADRGRVKPLRINGYPPTDLEALASLKYPLYRTYNITTWETTRPANRHARKLVDFLLREVEHLDPRYGFVSATRLKKAGWKFKGDELIAEPR